MKKISFFLAAALLSIHAFTQGIEFNQIQNWTGTGSSVAMLIVDFNDGPEDCFAFGYRFDGSKTAYNMLVDIAAATSNFSVNASSSWLNDLTYDTHSGIAGNPTYWMTFTFIDPDWEMNGGIVEVLTDSMAFGCSYTEFSPLILPANPVPAPINVGLDETHIVSVRVYPNPVADQLFLEADEIIQKLVVLDVSGRIVLSQIPAQQHVTINVNDLSSGFYVVTMECISGVISHCFTK